MFLPCLVLALFANDYYPPADREGGWRRPASQEEVQRLSGIDLDRLAAAFEYTKNTSKHGGLLVVHRGWLVYEAYFGRAHRDAHPNNASIGKSFTSIAMGMLMAERPEFFPDGLEQKVFTRRHLPSSAFPLTDPRKAGIKLGQLLAMTAGIRGNNPGYVEGKQVTLDPAGPDGWVSSTDDVALGKAPSGELNTTTLWCSPGEGYSYATSSVHIASMVLRHVAGMELEDYVREKLAKPLGWGEFGWGNKQYNREHTAGGGGIAPSPTDMLRFGYLLLRDGKWRDKQLVPGNYVAHCRKPSRYNRHYDYSLQFDVNGNGRWPGVPRDAFWKTGSGGFCLYVIPSMDLVVYKMAGRDDQYNSLNTGVKAAGDLPFAPGGPRDGWVPSIAKDEDVYKRTLELVLAAMKQ
jgi:CubicO group peptidase (beta-lactamase class C family)